MLVWTLIVASPWPLLVGVMALEAWPHLLPPPEAELCIVRTSAVDRAGSARIVASAELLDSPS